MFNIDDISPAETGNIIVSIKDAISKIEGEIDEIERAKDELKGTLESHYNYLIMIEDNYYNEAA